MRRRILGTLLAALASLLLGAVSAAASATFPHEDAVEYCRGNVARPVAFSDDGTTLCFDGYLEPRADYSAVERLKDNGLFVVRSMGGDIEKALSIAKAIHDRHATVVVYDYCVSACAVYFLTATDRTVVRRASLVTWHLSSAVCYNWEPNNDDWFPVLRAAVCYTDPKVNRSRYLRVEAMSAQWLRTRTVAPNVFGAGLDPPQSAYVRMMLAIMVRETPELSDVLWTWNPRHYKGALRTKVEYEAYPESQAEVDALSTRFGLGRVILDP